MELPSPLPDDGVGAPRANVGLKSWRGRVSRGISSIMEPRERGITVLPQLKPHRGDSSPTREREGEMRGLKCLEPLDISALRPAYRCSCNQMALLLCPACTTLT